MFTSIVHALKTYSDQSPDKTCFLDREGDHSYGAVWKTVCSICGFLRTLKLRDKECVVVECTQDARYMEIALALQLCGYIFVPVEMGVKEERFNTIVKETSSHLVLTDKPDRYAHSDITVLSIDQVFIKADDFCPSTKADFNRYAERPETIDSDTVAEILYTTGTTGKPKGIAVTHRNNLAIAENIICGTRMKKDNFEWVPLPLSHSHGLRTTYAAIVNGSSVFFTDGVMQFSYIVEVMRKYPVSSLDISPSAAKVLLKLSKGRLSDFSEQLNYIEIGTAALDEELKQELISQFPYTRLYNFYGTTEAGRTCILCFNKEHKDPGCIGKPAVHASFVVFNEDDDIIVSSKDNQGFIGVRGDMLIPGYWGDDKTDNLVNGYLKTTDLGYIDTDGYIYIFGRADEVINYKGIKISPEEIEKPVLEYTGIDDCACVPKPDPMCGFVPALFIVTNRKFNMDEFVKYLESDLDNSRMPKEIDIVKEIPRSYNGKLLRKKLKEQFFS